MYIWLCWDLSRLEVLLALVGMIFPFLVLIESLATCATAAVFDGWAVVWACHVAHWAINNGRKCAKLLHQLQCSISATITVVRREGRCHRVYRLYICRVYRTEYIGGWYWVIDIMSAHSQCVADVVAHLMSELSTGLAQKVVGLEPEQEQEQEPRQESRQEQ